MIRLILLNSLLEPAETAYGTNSLKVTVVSPAFVGSVAVSTVKNIGSISATAVADPLENDIVTSC